MTYCLSSLFKNNLVFSKRNHTINDHAYSCAQMQSPVFKNATRQPLLDNTQTRLNRDAIETEYIPPGLAILYIVLLGWARSGLGGDCNVVGIALKKRSNVIIFIEKRYFLVDNQLNAFESIRL